MPLYVIKPVSGDAKPRLVDAANQAQALRHVAKDAFAISVADAKQCLAFGKEGIEIETASAE